MRIFITGICGTLGSSLAKLHHSLGDQVWGCSRNEEKAVCWLSANKNMATLFVGDAIQLAYPSTDMGRLLPSMDRVYHLAAMKHVDFCEQHPNEAFNQNVHLTTVVSTTCFLMKIPLVFISSDKACLPQGVYGATKLLAEKIVLREGGAVVRLGNLIGSSGSVFHLWNEAKKNGAPIRLTDPGMTRYFLPVEEAAKFISTDLTFGRVSIPDPMKSVRMGDVANRISPNGVEIIGRRPGETKHQWLVAPGEKVVWMDGKLVIDAEGKELTAGLNSSFAPLWQVDELLHISGIST